jgi:tetratricopeptide (TPR) repeat protein
MKRYAAPGVLILLLVGLWTLLTLPGARMVGQPKPDNAPRPAEPVGLSKLEKASRPADKAAAPTGLEFAEQLETQCEFQGALELYSKLAQDRPKWAIVRFKIAGCLAALGKKDEAAKIVREVLAMDSTPPDLLVEARAALQELLQPKLSPRHLDDWKLALAYIQAGEELKKQESEDQDDLAP